MILFNQTDNVINKYAVYGPYIVKFREYYRLITGTFIHANIVHLLLNCYSLYVIGTQIENFMGRWG